MSAESIIRKDRFAGKRNSDEEFETDGYEEFEEDVEEDGESDN